MDSIASNISVGQIDSSTGTVMIAIALRWTWPILLPSANYRVN